MTVSTVLDAAGRRRSPATMPGYDAGRPPRNNGRRYLANPPTVEEIVAVMREANDDRHGWRLRALIVVLWRGGLPWINDDSLEILVLMAQEPDPGFDEAAARWIGRLLTETPPLTLAEVRCVVAMVERLPLCRESLHCYARRR
jgi:hypothetical protein